MNTIVYLVRHGETKANKLEIVMGASDILLDAHGKKNAKHVGEKLKTLKVKPDAVYASDLKRASTTADIIVREIGFEKAIQKEKNLREINYGDLEGMPVHEAKALVPQYHDKDPKYKFPGGESYQELYDRVNSAFKKIVKENQGKTIIIVTHLRPIQCILSYYNQWPLQTELIKAKSHEFISHEYLGQLAFNENKFKEYKNLSEEK